MGQVVNSGSSGSSVLGVANATKVVPAGYMGEFGNGLWRVFTANGNFTVPNGVDKIRVRVVGGGAGVNGAGYGGGGGCGYAHGEFSVTPGGNYSVTVGAGGASNQAGGTSSFGALISATGGALASSSSPWTGGAGGIGIGGDFQASGGQGGNGGNSSTSPGGGGGAGSQLGSGGRGGTLAGQRGGGGGIVGDAAGGYGGSPFGNGTTAGPAPDIRGIAVTSGPGSDNAINAVIRFPFDGFTGGAGMGAQEGGIGAGASGFTGEARGGLGGGSSGGGGGGGQRAGNATSGQPGLVIVEW